MEGEPFRRAGLPPGPRSFFFVIFADLRAFVVALLSGGLVEGAKIVGEELS
jgi:hypothetical protein